MAKRSTFAIGLVISAGVLVALISFSGSAIATPSTGAVLLTETPSTATCPNSDYQGSGYVMSLAQVVACAKGAGFTDQRVEAFASMAYQESSFEPGVTEYGGCAAGILQEGASSGGCPGPYPIADYNPSKCSTYSADGWNGVWYNPTCAFKWAYAYYHHVDGLNFWGSYLSDAYCKWSPNGFKGIPNPDGTSELCTGSGQNQADLPWSSVGF